MLMQVEPLPSLLIWVHTFWNETVTQMWYSCQKRWLESQSAVYASIYLQWNRLTILACVWCSADSVLGKEQWSTSLFEDGLSVVTIQVLTALWWWVAPVSHCCHSANVLQRPMKMSCKKWCKHLQIVLCLLSDKIHVLLVRQYSE